MKKSTEKSHHHSDGLGPSPPVARSPAKLFWIVPTSLVFMNLRLLLHISGDKGSCCGSVCLEILLLALHVLVPQSASDPPPLSFVIRKDLLSSSDSIETVS